MKKIIILTLAVMLLFTACSSKEDPKPTAQSTTAVSVSIPENYVGEATLQTIKTLVNMHITFEMDYFVKNHAPVDMSKQFEHNGATYAPVNGGEFSTLDEIKQAAYETYTKESADFMFNSNPFYEEIDGVLCFNTAYEQTLRGDLYSHDWTGFRIEPTQVFEDRIIFTVFLRYSSGDDAAITMTVVEENGNWRLVR